jgi:hypothetical protein
MAEIKCEIIKPLGILSSSDKGNRELNLVSWNNRRETYDIRTWQEDHKKPLKGITLTKDEIVALKDILNSLDLD